MLSWVRAHVKLGACGLVTDSGPEMVAWACNRLGEACAQSVVSLEGSGAVRGSEQAMVVRAARIAGGSLDNTTSRRDLAGAVQTHTGRRLAAQAHTNTHDHTVCASRLELADREGTTHTHTGTQDLSTGEHGCHLHSGCARDPSAQCCPPPELVLGGGLVMTALVIIVGCVWHFGGTGGGIAAQGAQTHTTEHLTRARTHARTHPPDSLGGGH